MPEKQRMSRLNDTFGFQLDGYGELRLYRLLRNQVRSICLEALRGMATALHAVRPAVWPSADASCPVREFEQCHILIRLLNTLKISSNLTAF